MNSLVVQEMLKQKQFDLDFYNRDMYLRQWFQFVYQSQLLLAERKQRRKAETHKTVPCQAWKDTGRCNYGKRCKFAHGPEELRPLPKAEVKLFNNPRYRTALCIKYTTFGYCPYGDQCHFIHDLIRIDLEKCLDSLSGSSLSLSQPLPKQTDDCPENACFSGIQSESIQLRQCKVKSQKKLTFECSKDLESCSEVESSLRAASIPKNDAEDNTVLACDPFRSDRVCKEEIEIKPLQFNILDDFLYVINPQRVLPKKQ
uniref:C3H1-type domain-containing protein n=1 Tax=Setaria digitata TaxID=48799 RepID=A0A915PW19_9BILA